MDVRTILGFIVLLVTVLCLFFNLWHMIKSPNIEPKMLFGFLLMVALVVLALIIALGHVKQDESHGLDVILGGIIAMSSGFTYWAFTKDKDKPKE